VEEDAHHPRDSEPRVARPPPPPFPYCCPYPCPYFTLTHSLPSRHEYFVFKVPDTSTTAVIQLFSWQRYGQHPVIGTLELPVGALNSSEEGSDKLYEMVAPTGASMDGSLRVRTQWRKTESDDWSPLPEVDDEEFPEEEDWEDEELSCWGEFRFWMLVVAESEDLNNLVTLMIMVRRCVSLCGMADLTCGMLPVELICAVRVR
jgi:hypothetical protein